MDPRFFVSAEIHPREVALGDGSKHTLHFRELSRADVRRVMTNGSGEDRSDAAERLVAHCLVNEDGSSAIALDDVLRMKPTVFNEISKHVMAINGIGQESETGKS